MNLKDFDALSFDCYGTLINWEAGILAELVPWASGSGIPEQELLAAYSLHQAAIEEETPTMLYPDVLAESLVRVGAQFDIAVSDEQAHEFGQSVPRWPAFPDSADALAKLATRFKLIILSNIDRNSFAASNKKLGVTFDAILTAQDIGSYKPSLNNFHALMTKSGELGIDPARHLHVAQSLFHDHVPAKQMGLPTVWINRRKNQDGWGATPPPPANVTPDWEFGSMQEFADAAID